MYGMLQKDIIIILANGVSLALLAGLLLKVGADSLLNGWGAAPALRWNDRAALGQLLITPGELVRQQLRRQTWNVCRCGAIIYAGFLFTA